MSKHTPGPWAYHARLSGSENHRGFRVGGKYFLAEVMPIDPDGIEGGANAALIAAAPDMLEALQRIASIEDKAYGGDWDEIECARQIARAAIINATGPS